MLLLVQSGAVHGISSWNRLESNMCWTESLSKVWSNYLMDQIYPFIKFSNHRMVPKGCWVSHSCESFHIKVDEWRRPPAEVMPLRNWKGHVGVSSFIDLRVRYCINQTYPTSSDCVEDGSTTHSSWLLPSFYTAGTSAPGATANFMMRRTTSSPNRSSVHSSVWPKENMRENKLTNIFKSL